MGAFTATTLLMFLFATLHNQQNSNPFRGNTFLRRLALPEDALSSFSTTTLALRSSSTTTSSSLSSSSPPRLILRALAQARRFDVVVVDVENVRGRSGFALSHAQLLDALQGWNTNNHDNNDDDVGSCHGQLVLVVDHGHAASRYWIPDAGYAIVFAGPSCKADDTIALDVLPFYLQQQQQPQRKILVVTADAELMQRCRRTMPTTTAADAASRRASRVEIMSPDLLLSDLEKIMDAQASMSKDSNLGKDEEDDPDNKKDEAADVPSGLVNEYELKLGGELLEIEALLRPRSGLDNKRRKKLRDKGQKLWHKLQSWSPTMLERVVDVLKNGRHCESVLPLSRSEQTTFLARWDKTQRSRRRKETTQDRIVLAEQLRLELEEQCRHSDTTFMETALEENETEMPSAKAYVYHHNMRCLEAKVSSGNEQIGASSVRSFTLQSAPESSPKQGPLRLVVISDTHGFERQLTEESNGKLPDGDVLLHLGDFAMDRQPDTIMMERLRLFDAWLATAAAHIPTKIVLRGNHDCRAYDFALSNATYVTQAKCLTMAGYKFAFVPYLAGGLRRKASLPKSCDVLVSHVPPHHILDRCGTGKYAGSKTLLKGAQAMTQGPPFLWLCGHIHESRGVVRNTVFCMNQETTIINAANANSGIASHIEYGPVVLQLGREGMDPLSRTKEMRRLEICEMDGQYVYMNQKCPSFFQERGEEQQSRQLLIAVDLGLRTGVSMFDDTGRLVRYENFHLDSVDHLRDTAKALLDEWELDMNRHANTLNNEQKMFKVTHVAIEGSDPPLADAWRQACNGQRSLLFVKPEEWRGDLLTKEEIISGESSKAASRRMAEQIVAEYGASNTKNDCRDFQTDMAESILLGLHVTRRLSWGPLKDPAVPAF